MAEFTRPTLAAIVARVQGDIEATLTGASARLRRTPERALGLSLAGASHALHGHMSWLARQVVPSSGMARRMLDLWASAFLQTPLILATPSTGLGTASGTGTVTAGTEFVRLADGALFTADATTAIGGFSDIAITSSATGAAANMEDGELLQLVSPIADVGSTLTIAPGGLTGGTDDETGVALLARLLNNLRNPPKGGGEGDYVAWALETPGVGATRAWEYRGTDGSGNPGTGRVAVTFVLDNHATSLIPDGAAVTAVQTYIDARAPAETFVFAPTPITLGITGTMTPDDATVKAAAVAEVAAMLLRVAEPGGTIPLSQINEAISSAAGETDHVITLPAADATHAFGELAVPPSSWTDA